MDFKRRKFLLNIVSGFVTVGALAYLFPFFRGLIPDFEINTALDIDLSDMKEGESRIVRWLGRNVLVVKRDPAKVGLEEKKDHGLRDPFSLYSKQPSFAKNKRRSRRPEHLLVYSACTFFSCEVKLVRDVFFEGFECPCDGSCFDIAGRVKEGSVAQFNLVVPYYEYLSENIIRLMDKSY
ncbi:MAG: ubiquinol-cytochrome c reductase iron-sulfur subunit [Gammaproteobacteria bacterium]|nr:ubiquinol-cytochrome c reductase iron-sulfur subunit [Gammaproteobacteria bacterium]|tara:strand:+ start:596 stop:1135 length:540 start_codon:yes stop_codon:yes gene_type:complete